MISDATHEARTAAQELLYALDVIHRTFNEINLPNVTERLAEYAWAGYAFQAANDLDEAVHELASAEELCGANFMLPGGDELFSDVSKTALRQLLNAVNARKSLDSGESVDIKELAALARVAEKTVRMATHSTRPGAMRVRKEGHWASIDAGEALAWLGRRSDFHPTRQRGSAVDQPLITSAEDLATTCKRWRAHKGVDAAALAEALDWPALQRKAYEKLEAGELTDQITRFPPQALLALGEYLGMPQPREFARQAFRVLAIKHADYLSDQQLTSGAN